MKGYLKNQEGIFQLAPKVTTVGKEGCDLVIPTHGVDYQHAVIEFSQQEDCFVLQDLNTAQGTYVNDCRVQNAAVRLAPGDIIRFGFGGLPYELDVENSSQCECVDFLAPAVEKIAYPPVHQRAAWTQPLTVISDRPTSQVVLNDQGLPQLRTVVNTTLQTWAGNNGQNSMLPPTQSNMLPPRPPATLRGRPLSAGSINRKSPQTASEQRTGVVGSGWVSSGGSPARTISATQQTGNEMMILQEKEQRILQLENELRRVGSVEMECQRKEEMIQQMKVEIQDLHGKIRASDATLRGTSYVSNDAELTQKLLQLENEVSMKRMEVQSLKEQINLMRSEKSSPGMNRQEVNDRIMEINSLRTELERVRKDKNITSGLVTQMQKDMANKDTTISRLSRDLEAIKKEIGEKDIQMTSLQAKFRRTQESKRAEDDLDAKDKELTALRSKFKTSENRLQEQSDLIESLKLENEKLSKQSGQEKDAQKRFQAELDSSKSKCQDLERAERLVRVDLEQASKRLERFRNRVVQVTYSTPGIRAPDKELQDDELMEQLKAIIDERTELVRKLQDSKDQLNLANSSGKSIQDNSKKLKQSLNDAVKRLDEKGMLSGRLKQEIDLVTMVSVDEPLSWMKDAVIALLNVLAKWEGQIEKSLEECGINLKISEDEPWKHISHLNTGWKAIEGETEGLRQRISEMTAQHKQDMETALATQRTDLENQAKDKSESLRIENEEKLNRAIKEIRLEEEEKRETISEEGSSKLIEMEANLESLKVLLLEKDNDLSAHKEAESQTMTALEELQKIEAELREQLVLKETSHQEEIVRVRQEAGEGSKKFEEEASSYKEQIRQHSVTICALEERLNKSVKKSKDYQSEITQLKKTVNELKSKPVKPAAPPKPKVIIQRPAVDVVSMEQTIIASQREVAEYKSKIHEQSEVIIGLRRDLAGATARLTDMTGELSEAQKEEIERNSITVRTQDMELSELRQQMVKLSQIIDQQAEEIKELNDELSQQKAVLNKYKNVTSDKELKIKDLESLLSREQNESKKHLNLIEEEGRITSELTAVGAQCRGERHEQVIARQREALTELRHRIKTLETDRPPLPTHDQALQQVIMLKKEVAELRANKGLADTADSLGCTILQQQISKARGIDTQAKAEVDMERSAHRETIEALEASENTYLTLLRGLASVLEMDDVEGLRSMAHIPKDERIKLTGLREQAVELLASRVKVLKERITRKDELLQGYERDLAKLRQAEKLAQHKTSQLDSLVDDVRSKSEEAQYLRESLHRTKDRLDQEKRLNSAVKSKKTFHLERENHSRNGWAKHHCPPEDVMGKAKASKKIIAEKMKRKNYEITTLKTELSTRERDLHGARRRLTQLENTPVSDRDPQEPPAIESH